MNRFNISLELLSQNLFSTVILKHYDLGHLAYVPEVSSEFQSEFGTTVNKHHQMYKKDYYRCLSTEIVTEKEKKKTAHSCNIAQALLPLKSQQYV